MEVTLKEHLESRIAALEDSFDREFESIRKEIISIKELTEAKFQLSQIAINKAEKAQELRNEAQNEWRAQSKDQTATYVTIESHKALKSELLASNTRNSEDIKALQLVQANLAGKASQSDVNSLRLISYISLAIGLSGLIITLIKLIGVV